MELFEFEIITYPAKTFKRLVFFCSESGQCGIDEVPDSDTATLQDLLNKRGAEGWELVQLAFGTDGVISFWKRRKTQS